jgi:hypothetical protein
MKKVIFHLVRDKIENELLLITPNLIRFLALKLIDDEPGLMVKIGNSSRLTALD